MNRIPLHSNRAAWSTGLVAVLCVVVISALVAWLWRPSKTSPAVPPPLAASSPVSVAGDVLSDSPSQARRKLAVEGRWSRLSARDQAILAPLSEYWTGLSFEQRLKWLDLALRFPALTPDEQARIQQRMAKWARMSASERGAARLSFQELRQLPPRDRLEQWEAYQELEPEERKLLALKAQAASQVRAVPRRSETSAPFPKSSGVAAEAVVGSTSRPLGGTVVQAPLGATTRLVSQLPDVVAQPSPGPRIATQPGLVDPLTLLPQARAARAQGPGSPSATGEETPGDSEHEPATGPTPGSPLPAPSVTPATAPSGSRS